MFGLFKKEEAPKLTDAQLWILAAAALPTLHFGAKTNYLGGHALTPRNTKGIIYLLDSQWDIHSTEELMQTLDWLKTSGHRVAYAQRTGRPAQTYVGWDFARYITVAGYGYVARYITEEAAWKLLFPAAKQLQSSFTSWKELGESYLAGRAAWDEDPDSMADFEDQVETLVTTGLWSKLDWNTPLV